jgi:hypothetical protein
MWAIGAVKVEKLQDMHPWKLKVIAQRANRLVDEAEILGDQR